MIENILIELAKAYNKAGTMEERLRIDEEAIGYIETKASCESLTSRYYDLYFELKNKYLGEKSAYNKKV